MNKRQQQYIDSMQGKTFEIFEIFKELCESNHLRYFAAFGTALGAVRHSGFIPWDDDIDICMPRPDYIKLVNLLKKKNRLADQYEFVDYLGDPSGGLTFGKIFDKSTTSIPKFLIGRPEYYTGIFMDIFPLDGLPNNIFLFRMHVVTMTLLRMIKKTAAYGSFYSQYSPKFEQSRRSIAMRLFCALIPKKLITSWFNGMAEMYKFDDDSTKYVTAVYSFISGHGARPFSRIEKVDFKDYIDLPFESTTIRVPSGYVSYLTESYGDYMKLPPKKHRIPPHGDGIVDANRSFEYYVKLHGDRAISADGKARV